MPRIEEGIEIYNIELDGCLNGVYTNEHKKVGCEIHNEIARIKQRDESDPQGISGTYDCFYFDYRNARVDALLKITNSGRAYSFEWRDVKNNKLLFEGYGYKMNEKQLAVHYWEPKV